MAGSTPTDVLDLTTDPAALAALLDDYAGDLVVDVFGGPGGWTAGIADLLKAAGLLEVALEWDAAACATRIANGLPHVIRCDVSAYPTAPFAGRTRGAILSPPCQTFSTAGGKAGARFLAMLAQAAYDVTVGARTLDEALDELGAAGALDDDDGNPDPRNGLILQPARWLRDLGAADPDGYLEWTCLEQVPPARPVFEAYAAALRALGWRSVVVVVLNAADYGVPQTRERVILLAHRTRVVTVPEPTHAKGGQPPSMFGPGRLPWVSMARALGWIGAPVKLRREVGASRLVDGERPTRDLDEPAYTLTGGDAEAGGNVRLRWAPGEEDVTLERGPDVELVISRQPHATRRRAEEPAPTIAPGKAYLDQRFEPATEEAGRFLLNRRAGKAGPNGDYPYAAPPVDVGVEPSPTLTSAAIGHGVWSIEDRRRGNPDLDATWAEDRPATVVASRDLVQHPGATANRFNDSTKTRNDGLRVTTAEGAILQGFPADYVWTGTKSKAWEQIGNVVCPPIARRVVAAVLGVDPPAPLPWHAYAFVEPAPSSAPARTLRMGTAAHSTERDVSEPAPTVVAGARVNGLTWEDRPPQVIDRAREKMARARELVDLEPDPGALF